MLSNYFLGTVGALEDAGRFMFFKGYKHMSNGAMFGKPLSGLKTGWSMSYKGGSLLLAPYAAYRAAEASRHHKLSATAGALISPMGALVGGLVGGPIGALAAAFTLVPMVESGVANAVQAFSEIGRKQRRLETGGYQDTDLAYTMRQRAAQEMSSSLLNARQVLGREAILMHQ